MKFTLALAASALVAAASATSSYNNVTYTTVVVDTFTTVCPEATTLAFNGVTYTVTKSQTLTVTNCPCTLSKPVYTTPVVYCSTCGVNTPLLPSHVTVSGVAPPYVPPPVVSPVVPPPAQGNSSNVNVVYTTAPGSPTQSGPVAIYTGAANKAAIGSAALVGLAGLAAIVL
jgi:hypothetical protein